MYRSYWNCTKFASKIRGVPKPKAATMEEWDAWHQEAKSMHPVRYWIAEEGLKKLQHLVFTPRRILDDLQSYISNRFVVKTHALTSTLKRGQWHEFEERLIYCIFDELVNYVEGELAWKNIITDDDVRKKYGIPKFFSFRNWRNPNLGLDYLKWETTLVMDESCGLSPEDHNYGKPTRQAETAQTILKLYMWWKYERPNRPDPYEASGWRELCAARPRGKIFYMEKTTEEKRNTKEALDKLQEIEEQYNNEDTSMMIELIKLRRGIWT